jgi:HD-GYP domain-containing protein (c-di-GMP phosphodiesterase class II)
VGRETLRTIIAERKPMIHNIADRDGAGAMAGSKKPVSTGWLVGLRTMVCVPMISQEQTMGILCVGCSENDRRPEMQERILKLTTLVGDITASALHRASLYEESRRRVHRLTSLRNINRALSAGMERSVIVSILLDQLMLQKGVDMVDLLLLDPYTRMLRFEQRRGYGLTPASEPGGGLMLRLNESLAGRVVLDRRYRSEADLTTVEDGGIQRTMFLAEGMRAYLAMPLLAHGEVLGVLELLRRTAEPFEVDWLEFVESLVGQVSTALNNAELYERIQRSNLDLVQAYDAVIEAWAQAMESRAIEPPGHTRRTLKWTLAMARAFGVLDEQLPHIRRGVLLHDIGKMAIPDPIQLKPGPLTPAELSEVRRHPHFAYVWLSTVAYLQPAVDIPYCHHEWWDGSGYPRGLRGAQIPLAARIFIVADVYDVLCSDRPHRPAWTLEQAAAYIREQAGTQFDPAVVTAFIKLLEAGVAEDEDE